MEELLQCQIHNKLKEYIALRSGKGRKWKRLQRGHRIQGQKTSDTCRVFSWLILCGSAQNPQILDEGSIILS
jgi:hypothetical protein